MALPADGPNEIKIRVGAISQLFDPLDSSPIQERDIDVHTHKFVVGWARELPREAAFTIVVEAPKEEAGKPEALRLGEAFASYFHSCADEEERDLRELFRAISQRSCSILRELGPDIQWLESFVTANKIYCVYIAANAAIIEKHAQQGGFPADRIQGSNHWLRGAPQTETLSGVSFNNSSCSAFLPS